MTKSLLSVLIAMTIGATGAFAGDARYYQSQDLMTAEDEETLAANDMDYSGGYQDQDVHFDPQPAENPDSQLGDLLSNDELSTTFLPHNTPTTQDDPTKRIEECLKNPGDTGGGGGGHGRVTYCESVQDQYDSYREVTGSMKKAFDSYTTREAEKR